MHVVIAGGTGFIGRGLCRTLVAAGHRVTVLSRAPREAGLMLGPSVTTVGWDGVQRGFWERALEGADAVVNLAGEPIAGGRWSDSRKRLLLDSRVGTTRLLVHALARCQDRPRTFVSASGIGIYGPCGDQPVMESSPAGSGFLARLAEDWEHQALEAAASDIRVVLPRFGMVLGEEGGALPRMQLPFRLFLGGPILPGGQWVSWIHRQDLISLMHWTLTTPAISGPVNAVSPGAVTMTEFCRTLGQVMHRPSWMPVPQFALQLALGELSTLMTTGQRVSPQVAQQAGFIFRYPVLKQALEQIVHASGSEPARMRASA